MRVRMTDQDLTTDNFSNVAINISVAEAEKLVAFFFEMVGNVSYNWVDSRILLPILNNSINNVFVDDVPLGIAPSKISKVFCSQMGVLALRECLDRKGREMFFKELDQMNSRLTSPQALADLLEAYFVRIDPEDLLDAVTLREQNLE